MSILFSPLVLKNVTLRNRIAMSPMCQYSARDGFANEWHLVHYGSRAIGGAGLIIIEATAVSPEGRITPADLGIWLDEHVEKLKNITKFISAQGAIPAIQLAHAGRKGSISEEWKGSIPLLPSEGGWQTFAPSPFPYKDNFPSPKELTQEEIQKIINDFSMAARRALQAGFQAIEIHAAHGYLIHEFLSPLTNQRDDEYGGSFGRRLRLLEEIIEATQKEWPSNLPIMVRISATDWHPNGWDIEQSIKLAHILKDKGIDLIDVSTGGLIPDVQIPVGYGYQLPFACHIKKTTGIFTGTVGLITNAIQAETILRNKEADLIIMGRELLRNPYFPLHAATTLNENKKWPTPYLRAKP